MAEIMRRAIWRWTERALVLAAVCSLLAVGFLEVWFFKTAPKLSDPVLGAIHPVNWGKTTVYVTAVQQLETDTLFWGSAVLLAVAFVIDFRFKPFRN